MTGPPPQVTISCVLIVVGGGMNESDACGWPECPHASYVSSLVYTEHTRQINDGTRYILLKLILIGEVYRHRLSLIACSKST